MIRLLFRGDFLANLSRLSQKILLEPGRLTQKKVDPFQSTGCHSGLESLQIKYEVKLT